MAQTSSNIPFSTSENSFLPTPNEPISPSATETHTETTSKVARSSLHHKRSFNIIIQSPNGNIVGAEQSLPEHHTYPTHFTNPNVDSSSSLPFNDTFFDYDLDVKVKSIRYNVKEAVDEPITLTGGKGKVRCGFVVILSGNHSTQWEVMGIYALSPEEKMVTYVIASIGRDGERRVGLYLRVPLTWSFEGDFGV
jgi:hypothetical protein